MAMDLVIETIYSSADVFSRLFVGITLLLTSILNQESTVAMVQLTITLCLIIVQFQGVKLLRRAMKLLIWLFVPILLLHALFTPGELIVSGMLLPVSFEGLKMAGWLALHLAAIFFSALLLFRLLTQKEWMRLVTRIPMLGHKFMAYTALLETGWVSTKEMIIQEKEAWKSDKQRLRGFFFRMAKLPARRFHSSRDDASELWNNWEQRMALMHSSDGDMRRSVVATLAMICSGLLLWGLYVSGL